MIQRCPDPYVAGESPVHCYDPRAKLATAAAYVVCVLASPMGLVWPMLWFAALMAAVTFLSRLPARLVLLRLTPVVGLIAIAGLGLLFEGSPVRFAVVSGKAVLCAWCGILIGATTTFSSMLAGLWALHVPETLVSVSGLAHRLVYVALDEARRMAVAYRARVPAAGPANRSRHVLRIALSLGVRAVARSERMEWSLLARGFDGRLRCMPLERMTARDVIRAAAAVSVPVLLLLAAYR